MEPTYTGVEAARGDGRDLVAEVTIRFRPSDWSSGLGESGATQRFLNARFGDAFATAGDAIWKPVMEALQAGAWRLKQWPEIEARNFVAQVIGVRLSEEADLDACLRLLSAASRKAVEQYFADIDAGRVVLRAEDVRDYFDYMPEAGFDEEFLACRRCFLEYAAEHRPGFLFGPAGPRTPIEQMRRERTLVACGISIFDQAVSGYLCGCRPEADALVEAAHQLLTLADETGERSAGDYGSGWGLGYRYTALAYLHWLRTGEAHEDALDRARRHFLDYYRRTKTFERRTANLAAPELLYLGAGEVLEVMERRLAARPGRGAAIPGGLFGDALRIVTATDAAERERLKGKLRKKIPPQFFRWISRGLYGGVAFILHAVFPRPEGPPSRLIERAWEFMPEIERMADYPGWQVAGRKRT